ncbi:MAG: glycosyl hydrolase [Bacteroidota bacterium]|nr:glycosyl hydrolase [Bacteroidota bacterium]|tara:strand:+ start:11864 stop:14893 length:3030 start_codon:yes stop_codon:yes gene_type:complete
MKIKISIFFTIILSALFIDLNAIENKDSLLNQMSWRGIGPDRGGRSLAVSGSPSRINEYYFGAVGGGLWKTIDGGQTWNPVTDGQIRSSSVGAVAVSESNPDIVYIGMGETELRGNIMQGDGVYKSVDAGKTWKHLGLDETQAIAKIRVHPKNPDIVYVAALGHPYGENPERGIFKSVNGGKSWDKVLYKSSKAGAIDLVMDPNDPETLYATIWQVYRTPYKMLGGGPDCGIYKSSDGGKSWKDISENKGLPERPLGKIGITVSGANSNRLWAIVEANNGGVYVSDDAGDSWELVNNERKLRQRAFYYSRIYADPKDEDIVYALNTGFYKSVDGGKTFDKRIIVPHGDNHDLWIDPNDPMRMVNANDGGGCVSVNGGDTWTDLDFPTSQFYHIMVTKDFPYHVCGAQQDNSTMCIPSEGWNFKQARGPHKQYYYAVGGGESGYISQHPDNLDWFYAGSQGALLTKYDRSNGFRRDIQVYPRFFSGEPASALPERWQWTFPIIFSPLNSNKLYTSSQHVWVSENDGQSWEKISPDLTYADPKTLGETGGIITNDMNGPEIYATVFALAPSNHDENVIWAGSDDGLVYITKNHGKTWENITPKNMPKDTRVSIIDESTHKPGTAYVAGKRYQMDDRKPYIWKTDDYGKTWNFIIDGIREDDFIHVVREDLHVPGLLYAGGEHGVWVSFDDGNNWSSLSLNMPDTQISDLIVTDKDIVVGTHGRSVYILDDISPIREMSKINFDKHYLFKPYYAARRVQNGEIKYYLSEDVNSLNIKILDSKGRVVLDKDGLIEESEDDEQSWYGADNKNPSMKKGLNSYTWNLRYPGATDFEGMIIWSARPQLGPIAPPGNYNVILTVDGKQYKSFIDLIKDPRIEVSDEVIDIQFQFAMEIMNQTDIANRSVIEIREIKDNLKNVSSTSSSTKRKKIKSLILKLENIESSIYQVKNQSGQDPLNFPIKVNNRLAYLRKSVESGDGLPTKGSREVFEVLKNELYGYVSTLDELKKDVKKYL